MCIDFSHKQGRMENFHYVSDSADSFSSLYWRMMKAEQTRNILYNNRNNELPTDVLFLYKNSGFSIVDLMLKFYFDRKTKGRIYKPVHEKGCKFWASKRTENIYYTIYMQ